MFWKALRDGSRDIETAPYLNVRFWEMDSLRGGAIVIMILFHTIIDLNYFGGYDKNPHEGTLGAVGAIGAMVFVVLVGISMTLSYSRARIVHGETRLRKKFITRGALIFSMGMAVTFLTWLFLNRGFVVFGILHLIGLSIILAYPFLHVRPQLNLAIGLALVSIGIYLRSLRFDFYWLVPFGFKPEGWYMVEYFPLLPWFGWVLVGLFTGKMLYNNYERMFKIADLADQTIIRFFSLLGRNSLKIYLAHQPIIIAGLYLLGYIDISFLRFPI